MSPEAMRGKAGFSNDVFSFGVYLWELATRELPWKGVGLVSIVYNLCVQQARLRTDDIISDGRYKTLPEMVARCWLKNAGQRPSFDELETEIESQRQKDQGKDLLCPKLSSSSSSYPQSLQEP